MIAPRIPAPLTMADFPVECPSPETGGGSHISARRRSWLNRGKSQVVFNGPPEEARNGTRVPDAEKLISCAVLDRVSSESPDSVLTSSLLQE